MAGVNVLSVIPHNVPAGYNAIQIADDTTGTLTIQAGATGFQIDVWGIFLSASTSSDVQFKTGSTSLTGTVSMIVGIPIVITPPKGNVVNERAMPLFTTNDGDNLVLASTGGARMSGIVWVNVRPTALV